MRISQTLQKHESLLPDLQVNSQFNHGFAIKRMPLPSITTPLEIDQQHKHTTDNSLAIQFKSYLLITNNHTSQIDCLLREF